MGTFLTSLGIGLFIVAALGFFGLVGYIILRRVAERKVFLEQDRLQLAEVSSSEVVPEPEEVDDRPDAIIFQFPVRPRESTLDSSDTDGSAAPLAELDEWRDRPPRPFQPRFRKP